MEDFTDNEEFEAKKKALEIEKLDREIRKIEAETEEIISKKQSAWAPMIGSIIIGFTTLAITYGTGFFDGKLALIEANTMLMEAKKDSLSKTIDSLKSIYRRDSVNFSKRIKNQDRQLDSLSQKFIQDKTRFDKERLKYGYAITQKEKEIGGLSKQKDSLSQNNIKLIDCYSPASDFIKTYCIKDDEIPYEQLWEKKQRPFYHRFSKSFEEIAEIDISFMNYQQFLMQFAGYRINSDKHIEIDRFIISEDGKKRIDLSITQGGSIKKKMFNLQDKLTAQFACWKKLNKNEKLQLLNQSIIRTR